jgi:hypothetical protein
MMLILKKEKTTQAVKATPHINQGKGATLAMLILDIMTRVASWGYFDSLSQSQNVWCEHEV